MTFTEYVLVHAKDTDNPRGELVMQVRTLICSGRFQDPKTLDELLDFARRRGADERAARAAWRSYKAAARYDAALWVGAGLPIPGQTSSS